MFHKNAWHYDAIFDQAIPRLRISHVDQHDPMFGNSLHTVRSHATHGTPATSGAGELAIHSVVLDVATLGRFETVEATIDLTVACDNPFAPAEIDVQGQITTPNGRGVDIPGFFYQPYCRTNTDDAQTPLLDMAGAACWKLRFTPTEVGQHALKVSVRDRTAQIESETTHFQVVASTRPGFIRVSPSHGRYFEHDDGTCFFPVGQNLQNDWPALNHLQHLANAGCNAVRPFMFCHWTWLEWSPMREYSWAGPGHFLRSYGGKGHYNQRVAWIADEFFRRCERDGLRVMVCLGADELDAWPGYDAWSDHPYNVANGGFLTTPDQFWTDAPRGRSIDNDCGTSSPDTGTARQSGLGNSGTNADRRRPR